MMPGKVVPVDTYSENSNSKELGEAWDAFLR
jgi:hypothetical protein